MPDRDDQLLADLVLSRAAIDRAAALRADPQWIAGALAEPSSQFIAVSKGEVLMSAPDAVAVVSRREELLPTFLGLDENNTAVFALHVPEESRQHMASPGALWASVRTVGAEVNDRDAGLMVTAIALDNWQRAHHHCPRCGAEVRSHDAGWAMRCERCDFTHFPRTDPAVIVLVIDENDRALLGRQSRWAPAWFSTLAGFVEAGESAEAAVRREVHEESGVRIAGHSDALRYLGSQPWPFPASLMLGYHAWAETTDITVDETEIAEARWFTRNELADAAHRGEVLLPPQVSIARKLIERWFGERIPGEWIRA